MHSVKPALVGSLFLLLLASGCSKERALAPEGGDACRYTLVRPERQQLRVWDGAFLDEDGRECFGRSFCFTGHERPRVHLLDVRERTVTTLAEGEGMRMHPRFAAGRLHFVEAEVRYEAVAGL